MSAWTNHYEISFGGLTRAVRVLLLVTIGCGAAQYLLSVARIPVLEWFGLSLGGLMTGRVWQAVSYMFLHGSFLHLFLNMLLLFMMGPETERAMGRGQFLILYFLSGVLGGVGWLIISALDQPGAVCIGASGAIFGIIGAFAALFPHRQITLLLFFVIPISMKAWVMGVLMAAVELVFLWAQPLGGGIANAAHLAGGLAGYIYARTVFHGAAAYRFPGPSPLPRLRWPGREAATEEEEIDRILDKIEKQGMHSLSRGERDRLHRKSRDLRGGR